ncbi:hypothetical protein ACO22_03498 [Paracoccidioides brasiliensis]|uniref:Uncharacterized protein n=1 Tax=Paracoccidioides brasiliensis TaxID=121759 RepID=A0A1D2JG15_PARBR|nr:hypothetical protein ACO22_03498 [Paracoccidioides brasiliensis]
MPLKMVFLFIPGTEREKKGGRGVPRIRVRSSAFPTQLTWHVYSTKKVIFNQESGLEKDRETSHTFTYSCVVMRRVGSYPITCAGRLTTQPAQPEREEPVRTGKHNNERRVKLNARMCAKQNNADDSVRRTV